MDDSKMWYQSKLFWQNVFMTIMGICLLLADVLTQTPVLAIPGILSTLAGVFGIIIRIWYTDVPVTPPFKNPFK